MRFAGDSLIQSGVDQSLPGSKRSYEELQNKPTAPSFNSDDLINTPEMKPGPYYPGQDIDKDHYIRQSPGSGISRLPVDGQALALAPGIAAGAALITGLAGLKKAETMLGGGNLHHGEVRPTQPKKEPAGIPTGLGPLLHRFTR